MTQRIFDVENEKDMADLWDILPDDVYKIKKEEHNRFNTLMYFLDGHSIRPYLILNWHDKTEITRPIQEATEADIGKICYFWSGKDYAIGELKEIGDDTTLDIYCMGDSRSGFWFAHCRRLTKQEIEELC